MICCSLAIVIEIEPIAVLSVEAVIVQAGELEPYSFFVIAMAYSTISISEQRRAYKIEVSIICSLPDFILCQCLKSAKGRGASNLRRR